MQQIKIKISKNDYGYLNKHIKNLDKELGKGLTEFLLLLDNAISESLDNSNNPTEKTILLEKIYDNIYNAN